MGIEVPENDSMVLCLFNLLHSRRSLKGGKALAEARLSYSSEVSISKASRSSRILGDPQMENISDADKI